MGLGSRSAKHDTVAAQKVAVVSEDYWAFKPRARVMTVDGIAGVVTAVADGPYPGTEEYQVTLDDGMGGGRYTASQLSPVNTTVAAGVHTADQDYPELGTILHDRPPIERIQYTAARTAAYWDDDGDAHDDELDGHGDKADWDEIHSGLEEMHRGFGVTLPEHVHKIVHDESRPTKERAHALLQHITQSGHHGGVGTHWTSDDGVAEGFATGGSTEDHVNRNKEEAERTRDFKWGVNDLGHPKGQPATAVMLHAHPPARHDIDENPDPYAHASAPMYGYHDHAEREIPIHPGGTVQIKGISWKPVHDLLDEPDDFDDSYTHHEFSETRHHRASLGGGNPFVRTASAEPAFESGHKDAVYLRFGKWPKDERSQNNVTGHKEDGVSVYDLDKHGNPMDPDPGYNRGHEHDESCDEDCDLDSWNEDYGNDTREEMQGRVHRAERARHNGQDRHTEVGHLVKGEMVGIGHDGEPLLRKVKRVGDWINDRHKHIPTAEPHHLAEIHHTAAAEPPTGEPMVQEVPSACSSCGSDDLSVTGDTGRSVQATCNVCNATMSSWGGQFTPELIGDPSNHPDPAPDPAGGSLAFTPPMRMMDTTDHIASSGYDDPRRWAHYQKMWDEGRYRTERSKQVGDYVLHHERVPEAHGSGGTIHALTNDGQYVGNNFYDYHPQREGYLEGAPEVHPEHRRRGLGTAMYDWTEELEGKPLAPGEGHSADAAAFWNNRSNHVATFSTWHLASDDDDYRMQHQPPDAEDGSPLHNLSENGHYPEDVYTHPHYYADYSDHTVHESLDAMRKSQGKPNRKVRIYRAMPAEHVHKGIQQGNWVTTSKEYARLHGKHHEDSKKDWPVISATVEAQHLRTDGNDIREYGYHGPDVTQHGVAYAGGAEQKVSPRADGTVRKVQRRPKPEETHPGFTFSHHSSPGDAEGKRNHMVVAYDPQENWAGRREHDEDGNVRMSEVEPEHENSGLHERMAQEIDTKLNRLKKARGSLSVTAAGRTLSWDEVGQHYPHVYGDPEVHGDAADGGDGEGIGYAVNHLAHSHPGDPHAENASVHDLEFHPEWVDLNHVDHNSHGGLDDPRVKRAYEGYRGGDARSIPPLVVVHRHGVYQVADGHHRAEGAKLAGKEKVPAFVAHSPHPDEPFGDGEKGPFHGAEPVGGGDDEETVNHPDDIRKHMLHDHDNAHLADAIGGMSDEKLHAWHSRYDCNALRKQTYLRSIVSSLDAEGRWHFTASWSDVRDKAKRLRSEGAVNITVASGDGIGGEVKGDNNVYETVLSYVPGSQKVAYWTCGCKWAAYAWGRSPAYKRFEGRMCSHALAMQFEAQARGMFGRTVETDAQRPSWMRQRTPVVVKHQRDTGEDLTRRAVPPGNMRRTFEGSLATQEEAAPVFAAVATALAAGEDPVEVMRSLFTLGYVHDDVRVIVRTALDDKRCPNCGAQVGLNAVRCPRCGTELTEPEPAELHLGSRHAGSEEDRQKFHMDVQRIYDKVQDEEREKHQDDATYAENPEPLKKSDLPEEHHGGWRFHSNAEAAPPDHMAEFMKSIGHPLGDSENTTDPHRAPVPVTRYKHPSGIEPLHLDSDGNAWARHFTSKPREDGVHTPVFSHWSGPHSAQHVIHNHRTFSQRDGQVFWRTHAERMNMQGVFPEEDYDSVNQRKMQKMRDSGWGVVASKQDEEADGPTHAGVVLKARDTGRILMLQRAMADNDGEPDPNAGRWEFPGGGIESRDHTSLHAAIREFEEEVGQKFPRGGALHHVWRAPGGTYHGHVVVIPEESQVALHNGRVTVNPDDPDGETPEQAAWWEIEHARKNPALREECKKSPWKEIAAAGGSPKTAAAWDALAEFPTVPGWEPPLHSDSENPGSTGFATSQDPPEFDVPDRDVRNLELSPGWLASLHEQPEPALPTTDGGEHDDQDFFLPTSGAELYRQTNPEISPTEVSALPNQFTGSVDEIVARFQATAGAKALGSGASVSSAGPSDGDIAQAARQFLSKEALKEFTFQEQQELITEGALDNVMARNVDKLDIADTHYSALEEALAAQAAVSDPDDLFI